MICYFSFSLLRYLDAQFRDPMLQIPDLFTLRPKRTKKRRLDITHTYIYTYQYRHQEPPYLPSGILNPGFCFCLLFHPSFPQMLPTQSSLRRPPTCTVAKG